VRNRTAAETTIILCGVLLLAGCRAPHPDTEGFMSMYDDALARTEDAGKEGLEAGSEIEEQAIDRFIDFYREYSTEIIRKGVRGVYAETAFFGDPFKSVEGIDAIEEYFLKMADPVESCTFEVTATDRCGGEYYFRWIMRLKSKAAGREIKALGVSHVRFDREGMVIFQQDYWDSSTLFDSLPVVGRMTRWVKHRLE